MWVSQETLQQICASCALAVTTGKLAQLAKRGESSVTREARLQNEPGPAHTVCAGQWLPSSASRAPPTSVPAAPSRPGHGAFQQQSNGGGTGPEGAATVNGVRRSANVGTSASQGLVGVSARGSVIRLADC